jgi:hypothetical protein
MSVFFSGTDNEEINENSANHNYYLSLIINNKGEMCAKVAFRGQTVETIQKVITFKGTKGEVKTAVINREETKEIVYIYDCEIVKEEILEVSDSFKDRLEVILEKDKRTVKKYDRNDSYPAYNNYGRNVNLFDPTPSVNPAQNWDNVGKVPSDMAIDVFLKKVIAINPLKVVSVPESLTALKKKFGNDRNKCDEQEVLRYFQTMMDNVEILYTREFGNKEGLEETVDIMASKLAPWQASNWIADELVHHFDMLSQDIFVAKYNNYE